MTGDAEGGLSFLGNNTLLLHTSPPRGWYMFINFYLSKEK